MAHARPMHAGHALGVRESQFSVFSGSSSAEDLLASLNDFPLVAPQPYVSLDGGRVPSPLIEEKEDVIRELQHSELPIHREHVLLSDERDYLDRERLSPMQEERGRILVNPSRALRTRPNVVMDHYDPDTNIHTFKIAYPSRGRSEQEHHGSPEPPHAAYASPRTTASTPSISSPLTPTYPSGSSSSSVSVARDRVRASTLPTSTAPAYYVEHSAPPSSPSLVQATPPFVRRKINSPVDRLPRPPPDISLPLAPTRTPPVSRPPSVDTARRQQAHHAPEIEHVHELDRRHSPSAGAARGPARLMSADELGAYREFLTRRAEDCVQDARSFTPPSPAPRSRGDDAASDFSWDAQSVAPSMKSGGRPTPRSHRASPAPPMSPVYPRSPSAHPTSPTGSSHTAVQEDLMQALKAVRKQEDDARDVHVWTVPEEEHYARRGTPMRAPPHVRPPSAPRARSASRTDPLASPAQTVLSSLGDDDEAMRDLLPDFLDLGVDADTRHAPTASSSSRNMMWVLEEERVLSSVTEGAAASNRPPPLARMLYHDGDSSGWIGDDDYELADPILAPTPIPGSRPRKVHSQPDLTHPLSFLRPPLMKSNSHAGSSSINSHPMGFDSDIDVDPRHRGRMPLHLDTSVMAPGSRYRRHSPLERLQEHIAQLDPRDVPGYQSPTSPRRRAHNFPTQEVLYDREGRAYIPRRLARPQPQPDYEVAYEDADGTRIVYERADRAFERRYDDFPDTAERYAVRDRPPYSAREYIVCREHEHEHEYSPLPREYTPGLRSGSGTPVSREPPHLDDERPPPARAYYPAPRLAARTRAHSGSSQREYVLYDDREYLEYRTRSADADRSFSPRQSQQSQQSSEYPSSASGDFSPRGAHPPERRAPQRSATLEAPSRPDEHLAPSPVRSSPPSQSSSETKSAPAPAHQPAHSTSSFSTDASDPKAKGGDAGAAGDKPRAATPAPKPPRRTYSPELISLAASPMGFSGMSFRQARPKPKPKPKAKDKDKKSGPAGALHAAGVSEPNFKKSSTFSVSEEEVKSPRKGLFGKRKKA